MSRLMCIRLFYVTSFSARTCAGFMIAMLLLLAPTWLGCGNGETTGPDKKPSDDPPPMGDQVTWQGGGSVWLGLPEVIRARVPEVQEKFVKANGEGSGLTVDVELESEPYLGLTEEVAESATKFEQEKATLTGDLKVTLEEISESGRKKTDFHVKMIWRDGRWQLWNGSYRIVDGSQAGEEGPAHQSDSYFYLQALLGSSDTE